MVPPIMVAEKRDMEEKAGGSKRARTGEPDWVLEAVLDSKVREAVPLVLALAVEVVDRRQTSALVKTLADLAPLGSLQHLKRVRSSKDAVTGAASVQLLLWAAGEGREGEDREAAALARLVGLGVGTEGLGRVTEERVPDSQPVSREQYEGLRAVPGYWPTNFHEDKYLESLLTGSHQLWGAAARAEQERMLKLCGSSGGVVVGAGRVVAAGQGSTSHPLAHTAMVLADLVARSQGGGAWQLTTQPGVFLDLEQEAPVPGGEVSGGGSVPASGPYLCTGYTVYLAREPCHMCAMALIHSRAARLVYGRASRDGALASLDRLHTREGINHRYEVFRVLGAGGEQEEQSCS